MSGQSHLAKPDLAGDATDLIARDEIDTLRFLVEGHGSDHGRRIFPVAAAASGGGRRREPRLRR